jgi:hypothetical protein
MVVREWRGLESTADRVFRKKTRDLCSSRDFLKREREPQTRATIPRFPAEIDAEKRDAAYLDGVRRSLSKVLGNLRPGPP